MNFEQKYISSQINFFFEVKLEIALNKNNVLTPEQESILKNTEQTLLNFLQDKKNPDNKYLVIDCLYVFLINMNKKNNEEKEQNLKKNAFFDLAQEILKEKDYQYFLKYYIDCSSFYLNEAADLINCQKNPVLQDIAFKAFSKPIKGGIDFLDFIDALNSLDNLLEPDKYNKNIQTIFSQQKNKFDLVEFQSIKDVIDLACKIDLIAQKTQNPHFYEKFNSYIDCLSFDIYDKAANFKSKKNFIPLIKQEIEKHKNNNNIVFNEQFVKKLSAKIYLNILEDFAQILEIANPKEENHAIDNFITALHWFNDEPQIQKKILTDFSLSYKEFLFSAYSDETALKKFKEFKNNLSVVLEKLQLLQAVDNTSNKKNNKNPNQKHKDTFKI